MTSARARFASPPRLARVVAAFALFAFFAATLLAGHRYFHCVYMDESALSSCCPAEAHERAGDAPSLDDGRCCETKQFAAIVTGVAESSRVLVRAPFVALAANAAAFAPVRAAVWSPRARDARAGPPSPPPRDYRLRLMISLT